MNELSTVPMGFMNITTGRRKNVERLDSDFIYLTCRYSTVSLIFEPNPQMHKFL